MTATHFYSRWIPGPGIQTRSWSCMAQALHVLLRETWEDGAGFWGGGRKQSPSRGWDTAFPSLASPGRENRNSSGQNKKATR